MKRTVKSLAFLLVVAVLLTSFISCGKENKDPTTTSTDRGEQLQIEPISNEYITLSATPIPLSATSNTLQQTLTATIIPASAANKKVDWTVAWADSGNKSKVTDYVTVIPKSNGSTTATVTCRQAFSGNIIITVTTRDGGYTATCICKYVGTPTSFTIAADKATLVKDQDWNKNITLVESGNTYYFDLVFSNALGEVGEDFTADYTFSVKSFGGIDTYQKTYDSSGSLTGTTAGKQALMVADLMDSSGYCYTYFSKPNGLHTFFTVRISNGKLMIEAEHSPSDFSWEMASRAGKAVCTFDGYTDDKMPYASVTVTERNTGLSQTIHIRTVSSEEVGLWQQ